LMLRLSLSALFCLRLGRLRLLLVALPLAAGPALPLRLCVAGLLLCVAFELLLLLGLLLRLGVLGHRPLLSFSRSEHDDAVCGICLGTSRSQSPLVRTGIHSDRK